MARAWREVVHATVQDDADIAAWNAHEDVTSRLVRAVIAGCKAEPALNASFDACRPLATRERDPSISGLRSTARDGLFVPVLRDVGARNTAGLGGGQIDAFKQCGRDAQSQRRPTCAARQSRLSNFGSIAGRHAALIVMPPQVAILGVGRTFMLPVQARHWHRIASRFAAVTDLRSPRRHRRHGGALLARGHRRPRSRGLNGPRPHAGYVFVSLR